MKLTLDYIRGEMDKEGYVLMSKEYINARTHLKVKCPEGHEYMVRWCNYKSGYRCPVCAGKKKYDYNTIKGMIEAEGYKLISKEYINAHTKMTLECDKGHQYQVAWNQFQQGIRCPICSNFNVANKNRLSYDEVKSIIKSREGFKLLSSTYKNNKSKMLILCDNGHEFYMSLDHFRRGYGCPKCKEKPSTNAIRTYMDREGYELLSEYVNAKNKLKVRCPEGHKYRVNWNNFKSGYRCPFCSDKRRNNYDDIIKIVKSEGYKLLSDSYINNKSKLKFECDKGHVYEATWSKFCNGCRCPYCAGLTSKPEKELYEFVNDLIPYKVIENDKTQIFNSNSKRYLELDIWIPYLRKAIEFNGEYWHSLEEVQKRDAIKKYICESKNIDLCVVEYENWINDKKGVKRYVEKFLKGGR